MRKAFINTLIEQSRINQNIYLLVGDVGFNLVEPFQQEFPDRFINVGIAEQSMIGIATGLAMQGKKVFCYSLGNFPTLRCLEQIRNDVCYHNLDVKIVSSGAGLYYGALGSSHHATEDIAVMRALPNMTVISPCDPLETEALTKELCTTYNTPTYLRLQGSNDECIVTMGQSLHSRIGVANILCYGNKMTIISCGSITKEVYKIRDKFNNIHPAILSYHTIKPFDTKSLVMYCCTSKFIVTVEEHNLSGGLGSVVAENMKDLELDDTHLLRIGLQNKFCKEVGSQEYLRKINGLDAESIVNKIKEAL